MRGDRHMLLKCAAAFAATCLVATSCSDVFNDILSGHRKISVKEASAAFEVTRTNISTKAVDSKGTFTLYPGEIIPDWSRSKASYIGELECLDTPLSDEEYKYRAVYASMIDSLHHKQADFYAKLITIRRAGNEKINTYVVYFIPTYTYSKSHKKDFAENILNGDRIQGDFSGVKIWVRMDGSPVLLDRYRDGRKTAGVSFLNCKNMAEYEARLKRAVLLLGMMSVQRGHRDTIESLTKSPEDEDDAWVYLYDDLYYNTGTGTLYWDSNGDGIPDTLCEAGGAGIIDNSCNDGDNNELPPDGYDNGVYWSGSGGGSSGSGDSGNGIKLSLNGVSYMGYSNGNCFSVASDIARQLGAATGDYELTIFRENDTHDNLDPQGLDFNTDAMSLIMDYLNDGIPVVVGVHYDFGREYNDGTVDHWVVVYGYGWDSDGIYFDYNETNRTYAFWDDTHGDQFRFREDSSNDWLWAIHYTSNGISRNYPIYTLTAIRRMYHTNQ